MREDICSIPINDIFGPKDGCPICRMRDMLEERLTKYITGAAMMEPDVRIETNRLGFCKDHFDMILSVGSRLSVALILESHLKEIEEKVLSLDNEKQAEKKAPAEIREFSKKCFICENIEKMKDGVIIINNARGGCVVERDLADALNSGKVAAAGLDVVSTEPISGDNPLLTAKNCIITPHISWASRECRQRILDTTVENVRSFLAGTPKNVVNP